jgi:hypothetical protein
MGQSNSSDPPEIFFKLEIFRGIDEIAAFLKIHERTAQRLLRDGKLPAKKDETGVWTLRNLDYYRSLQG